MHYKLLVKFVCELAEKALLHAYGTPGEPDFDCHVGLNALTQRYGLQRKLETSFGALSPQDQTLIGNVLLTHATGSKRRLRCG